jgi:hypothetical protein
LFMRVSYLCFNEPSAGTVKQCQTHAWINLLTEKCDTGRINRMNKTTNAINNVYIKQRLNKFQVIWRDLTL